MGCFRHKRGDTLFSVLLDVAWFPIDILFGFKKANPLAPVISFDVRQGRGTTAVHNVQESFVGIEDNFHEGKVGFGRPAGVVEGCPSKVVRDLETTTGLHQDPQQFGITPPACHVDNGFAKVVARIGRQTTTQQLAQQSLVGGPHRLHHPQPITGLLQRRGFAIISTLQTAKVACAIPPGFDHAVQKLLW